MSELTEIRMEPLLTFALNVDDRDEQVAMSFGRAFSNHTQRSILDWNFDHGSMAYMVYLPFHERAEICVMQPFRFREIAA